MPIPTRLSRMAAVGALGVSLIGSALAIAPSAQAADTGTTRISCSAVKVRTSPSKTASVKGIAYKGDKDDLQPVGRQGEPADLVHRGRGEAALGRGQDQRLGDLPVRQPIRHERRPDTADPEVAVLG